jgi:hypothetical protein
MKVCPESLRKSRPLRGWDVVVTAFGFLLSCTRAPKVASIAEERPSATAAPIPQETPPEGPGAEIPVHDAGPRSEETRDGRVVLPEDFPAGTSSLKVLDLAHVLGRPHDRARYIGKITRGTRVA